MINNFGFQFKIYLIYLIHFMFVIQENGEKLK